MQGRDKCTTNSNLGCCNPDGDPNGAWCYVVGGKCAGTMDYDYCPSTKKTGETKWTATQTTSFAALGDHNSCRNPDGDSGKIWCYVSDKKWEYCEPFGRSAHPYFFHTAVDCAQRVALQHAQRGQLYRVLPALQPIVVVPRVTR